MVKPEGAETLEVAGWGALDERRGGSWIWVDLLEPRVEEVLELGARFGVPDPALEDVLDADVFPKLEDFGGVLLVAMHGLVATGDRVATTPLVCLLGRGFLLTFHRRPLPGLEWLAAAVQEHPAVAEGGPDRLLAGLADAGARRFLPLVDGLEAAVDELEDKAICGDPDVMPHTQSLRRDAVVMRRVLGPQRQVMLALSQVESPLVGGRARRRFLDAYDRHQRAVESLDAARLMLTSVIEVYRSTVAERTNDAMKVLTVFSSTLLPLSVMAGIYGMNFEHMPELSRQWAYPAVLAVMAVTVVGLLAYFVRRGFVGGPRVPRLRTVGRGVAHLVGLPVRTAEALTLALARAERHPSTPPGRRG
ncbi:MAG: magnesium transporter CorA family protein [Acidimicrobiales bacterium]